MKFGLLGLFGHKEPVPGEFSGAGQDGSYLLKRGARSLSGSTALPVLISTEAERKGEICSSAILLGNCFSTEESWAFGQGDEKRLLFSSYRRWKRRPPLCHLDRSAA
jgi:hypothetical protein